MNRQDVKSDFEFKTNKIGYCFHRKEFGNSTT